MEPEPGLLFREVMAGGFALGETDPAAGEQAGRRAGTRLALHARVSIPSLARFLGDPEHTCGLDGQVRFAPLGGEVPADSGFAKLFAPTTDPNLKVMAYRATFRHNGATYCLDGVKHVRRHSVLHAWRDTTTLFCRLHDGTGTTGRVIGAGTLHLTPLAFARQLGTFRTTNTPGIGRRVSTLTRFLGFFTGQTVDTYFRRARIG